MARRSSSVFPTAESVAGEIQECKQELDDLRRLHRFLVRMEKQRSGTSSPKRGAAGALIGVPADPAPVRVGTPTECEDEQGFG